jgi:cytosine/adenosine deaminase-related metal-dependent hydrolase
MVAEGLGLAVGTDSLASSPDLSVFGELSALHAAFPSVSALRWLEAATLGGAHALRLATCGSLTPGSRPGVLDVHLAPEDLGAPLEALVRNPRPDLRWVARA